MPENHPIEYPETHPHSKELRELRQSANLIYGSIKTAEQISRDEYKEAMRHLVAMGEAHKAFHGKLKEIVEILGKIEDLGSKPFI